MKDYKEWYEKISAPVRENETAVMVLNLINRILTRSAVVAYPLALAMMYMNGDSRLFKSVCIPAVFFVLVTVFRNVVNRKRPYEIYEITQLIDRPETGKSMPSRHVFSMAVIAMVFLYQNVWLGALFLFFALLLSIVRVIGGVHFISDVAAGLFVGIAAGSLLWIF